MLAWVAQVTGARRATRGERIASLWSSYGELFRVHLDGADRDTVVVKHVRPPTERRHPRGWQGDRGHQRKLRSYQVELGWYRDWSSHCGVACRVPRFLGGREAEGEWLLVLEDLDRAGFPERRRQGPHDVRACLDWLAAFHASFVGQAPTGLWPEGTYWHLATRPDELAATEDASLRAAAAAIDARLSGARFQTLVHGDAKLANFCFGPAGVAAVDFQYVGGGCGMKDVAYFLSSVLSDRQLQEQADALLDHYFATLRGQLPAQVDGAALEAEWRALWPWAWADFTRFLAGWAPGHWKLERYALARTGEVLETLGAG